MNSTPSTSPAGPLVFITGASSGIGQAMAARFARDGYRLALVARRTAEMQAWAVAQGFDEAK
jgi:NADP-dependent 3-hydroxy acid dehydrogenase YdfG